MNWLYRIIGFVIGWFLINLLVGCGMPDMPRSCKETCKADIPWTIRRVCKCNMQGEVLP